MQPYNERAAQVAIDSSIAVMVVLTSDNTDMDFVPLRPHLVPKGELIPAFTRRDGRIVGVIGLCGAQPRVAFKEPLEPHVIEALGAAFVEYVRNLLGESFTQCAEAAEISELERLYLLPDTRPN